MVAPGVPDLTIIDLPGIVRTTVDGQDASVVDDVRGLLDRYLKLQRTIFLAVSQLTDRCEIKNRERFSTSLGP